MFLPSSSTLASQITPSSTLYFELTPDPISFENSVSKISNSSLAPPVKEGSTNPLQGDSSTAPIDLNTLVDTRTEDSPIDTSAGMAAPVGHQTLFFFLTHLVPLFSKMMMKKIAMGDERPSSSERTLSRSSSPTPKSLDEPSIQPENILDPEDGDKESEDEVLATVKKGRILSQPTSRKFSMVTK
ncbi:hypothetical protein HAX54_040883 [Datura stramonium]|uniref:Uncharacterized protein n=1 Tax=Datura stramonium TaxID=4076 RepID=A0ABS8SKQ5_DATST|nr:hypothetical protein [Datura stramonium]